MSWDLLIIISLVGVLVIGANLGNYMRSRKQPPSKLDD